MTQNTSGDKEFNNQRRRREEEQVELRVQRTESFLNKKRVASKEIKETNSFETSKELLFSSSLEDIYNGTYDCRTRLSVEINPPIKEIIDSGIVPRFVELLNPSFYSAFGDNPLCSKCRFEAAWVLTNIASGTSDQTKYVVKLGAVPLLVKMISESNEALVDQCIWALGNIAGDTESLRDMVLETGALDSIIELIRKYISCEDKIKLLRNLVWVLSNLNRGRNPFPTPENMHKTFVILEEIAQLDDMYIVTDAYWCLSYIVDASSEITDLVLKSQIMKRTFDLISSFASAIQCGNYNDKLSRICANALRPIIVMLGNIVTGNEEQTNAIITSGFLQFFHPIFYLYENKKTPIIRKDICWLISNITAGTPSQVQYILESDLLNLIIDVLNNKYGLVIRKEACVSVHNILYFCVKNPQYLQRLLDRNILQALQSFMMAIDNYPDIQAQVLDSVRYALEAAERIEQKMGTNPVTQTLIDTKFIDEIEDLQDSKSSDIVVQKAYNIIVTYFEGEEEIL